VVDSDLYFVMSGLQRLVNFVPQKKMFCHVNRAGRVSPANTFKNEE
jgi:hypothetical protein